MKVKPDLITVIPSGVETATQLRMLSGRGQAFNPVAQLTAKFAGYLDFARYDGRALQLNCASHVHYCGGDQFQFLHSLNDHIGIFQPMPGDCANNPAAFRNFPKRVCRVA